jgi:hypothetical protein
VDLQLGRSDHKVSEKIAVTAARLDVACVITHAREHFALDYSTSGTGIAKPFKIMEMKQ